MFSVIFEVHPRTQHWDTYLGIGKMLRPEIEQIDGFVDNIRYRSLTRDGWILSLSGWRDEKGWCDGARNRSTTARRTVAAARFSPTIICALGRSRSIRDCPKA